jgi:hypothetical protein
MTSEEDGTCSMEGYLSWRGAATITKRKVTAAGFAIGFSEEF